MQLPNENLMDGTNNEDDPYLLDFGTSVNVNEDLRRTIRSEVVELEESITSLKVAVKNEERTGAQLKQDFSHAFSEMRRIGRGAVEQVENAEIHCKLVQRLKVSLEAELLVSTNAEMEQEQEKETSARETTSSKEMADDDSKATTPRTNNKHALKKISKTTTALSSSIEEIINCISGISDQKKATEEATLTIQNAIATERLDESLAEIRKSLRTAKEDTDNESQRLRSMQEAILKTRSQSGEHARSIAENAKRLGETQSQHHAFEKDENKKVVEEELMIQTMQSNHSKEKSKLATLSSQLDQIQKQIDEVDSNRAKLERLSSDKDQVAIEIQNLKEIETTLQAEEQQEVKNHEEAKKLLLQANLQMSKATEAQESNDRLENETIAPGKVELTHLSEQSEVLAQKISDAHERLKKLRESSQSTMEALKSESDSLASELVQLQTEREGKQSKISHFVRIRDESKENWNREAMEFENLEKQYQLAYDAEKSRIDALSQRRQEHRKARLEAAEHLADQKWFEMERKLQVLSLGSELIDNADESTKKILQEI